LAVHVAGTRSGPASLLEFFSPPRWWVRAELVPIAHAGDRAVVVPRIVSPYLGPTAEIYEWPPRRVGGLL